MSLAVGTALAGGPRTDRPELPHMALSLGVGRRRVGWDMGAGF
jgi:hypothetical protein